MITSRLARPGFAVVLVVVWVALWGDLTWANVASGVVAAGVVLALSPRTDERGEALRLRPVGAVRFAIGFLVKMVEATLVVAWEVATPKNRIREAIVAVPLGDLPDVVVTLAANAVSLTPGTLTLEVVRDPTVVYVHVWHLDSIDGARDDIYEMVALACGVFGCPVPIRPDVPIEEET